MDGGRRGTQPVTAGLLDGDRIWHALACGSGGFWAGQLLAAGFLACALFSGLAAGGHMSAFRVDGARLTDRIGRIAGLAIQEVKVEGSLQINKDALIHALQLKPGASMLNFDALSARRRLEQLNWVASAQVLKLLPGRIFVKIAERKPFARWQIAGVVSVVDSDGITLSGLHPPDYGALRLVVGTGAAKNAEGILQLTAAHSRLDARVRAFIRVADRRWNLRLMNGITVKLPERDVESALKKLVDLDKRHGLLSRAIKFVDFRLPDRITFQPNGQKSGPGPVTQAPLKQQPGGKAEIRG